jgi:hypothetical protein
MRSIGLAALAAVAAAAALAAPAGAEPPTHSSFDVAALFVHQPCGLVEGIVFHVRETELSDGSVRAQVAYEGTITNPATGESWPERGHQTVVFRPDGSLEFSGTAYVITVPGEGLLLLEAGRLVLDADGNIVHASAQTAADVAAKLCAALA